MFLHFLRPAIHGTRKRIVLLALRIVVGNAKPAKAVCSV